MRYRTAHRGGAQGGRVSQYTDLTRTWKYRKGIAINGPGGAPAPVTDISVTVPPTDEHFWDNVQPDGDDIRITGADGITLKTYQFSSAFNATTRVCAIQADEAASGSSTTVGVAWLYYGCTDASAGSGSFVAGTMWTGQTLVSRLGMDRRMRWRSEPPGVTAATDRVQKTATEEVWVAIQYREVLAKRRVPYGGQLWEEEPSTFTYAVYDGASAQAAMIDLTTLFFDNEYVYVKIKAGTSGSVYTAIVTMTTTGAVTGTGQTKVHALILT
jgi:hypothetical protein